MALSTPEASTMAGLATAAVVTGIFVNATPPITDVRNTLNGSAPHNDVNKARRQASWMAAAVVGGVSLITKDPNIFVMGGVMVIGWDLWTRYSNDLYPPLQKILSPDHAGAVAAEASQNTQVIEQDPYSGLNVVGF